MGRKLHRALLTVNQIEGIERVVCDGESHRIVLLSDGQIALPDHNRRLVRLDDEMRKKAGLAPCGCLKRVRELRASLQAGWTGDASEHMPEQRDGKTRYNARADRSPLFHTARVLVYAERKKAQAAKALPGDPLAVGPFFKPSSGRTASGKSRIQTLAEQTFRAVVAKELFDRNGSAPAIKIRPFHLSEPECIEALKKSPGGRDVAVAGDFDRREWTFFFDVVRWYTKLYRTDHYASKGVLLLRDLGGGRYAAFRPTPGKQGGRVASATMRSDGEVLLKGRK